MPTYQDVLPLLPAFRSRVLSMVLEETPGSMVPFGLGGAFGAFASAMRNIHATGIGLRFRDGQLFPDEIVLKLFVYQKIAAELLPGDILKEFSGIHVDVEQMPVQQISTQRDRIRPVPGGVSIAPLGANFVGTLGCYVARNLPQGRQLFVLSNNHVLAGVNQLPAGTPIVQPGPETPPFVTVPADAFGALHSFIPLQFPTGAVPVANRFDAALAAVNDTSLIQTGVIFGGVRYDPSRLKSAVPGMRVIKCGRTTGVTRGVVTATNVQGLQVNYGTTTQPRITVFDDVVQVVSTGAGPFSMPGDSGSVILEETSGNPVALLFSGDGLHTSACDIINLCGRLGVLPV